MRVNPVPFSLGMSGTPLKIAKGSFGKKIFTVNHSTFIGDIGNFQMRHPAAS